MAGKKTPEPDQSAPEERVWVVLTQTHELPGMKLVPGRARVTLSLRDELKAAGKIEE